MSRKKNPEKLTDSIIAVTCYSLNANKMELGIYSLLKKLIEFDAVADWIKLHHL